MPNSLTHVYYPRIEQTEPNLFVEEYYSSTDTKIYMDNVEQTEIGYINYSLQEQLKPLYGYASRTFDDVAVGNRIVTGTFKVPIKNPEPQSQMEDIVERSHQSSFPEMEATYAYNESQQQKMLQQDWIKNTNQTTSQSYNEDDTTFEYRMKLISLGYDLSYDSSNTKLIKAIKQFQQDNKMEINGKLTSDVMNKIDEAIKKAENYKTITVLKGTKLYLSPTEAAPFESLQQETVLYIIDTGYDDNWIHVMTVDGKEGFIQMYNV